MDKKLIEKNLKKATNSLFDNICDLMLWQMGLFAGAVGKTKTARGMYQTFCEADKFLENYNHQTIRNAWSKLKRNGFFEIVQTNGYFLLKQTVKARERLVELVPSYQEKRLWNKKIYIITYDIPEKYKRKRDILREAIKKMGAGLLLESVWICPYNIKKAIDIFVEEKEIPGTIIFSNTGREGAIGDKPLSELIIEVYKIGELNSRYEEFLALKTENKNTEEEMIVWYLSILKNDPQLPFELLPDWWKGEEAYEEYKKIKEKITK